MRWEERLELAVFGWLYKEQAKKAIALEKQAKAFEEETERRYASRPPLGLSTEELEDLDVRERLAAVIRLRAVDHWALIPKWAQHIYEKELKHLNN